MRTLQSSSVLRASCSCTATTRHQHRARPHPAPRSPAAPAHTAGTPCCRQGQQRRRRGHRLQAHAASPAAVPEQPVGQPRQLLARIRAACFYCFSMAVAIPLFAVMVALGPYTALFDRHRRLAQHFVNDVWARISILFFYKVTVEGWEHLPKRTEAAVYIANHQSFLDIFTLFYLDRPFKFVSKTSNFLIPIVGWSMFLTGHIPLNRMDRKSQVQCLGDCKTMLAKGASVLFFPEGTRSQDARLGAFKKGAFTVAAKAKVPVVPITLLGTGDIMPNKQENKMFPGHVHVIIHPPIPPGVAGDMMEASHSAVASSMPRELVHYPH